MRMICSMVWPKADDTPFSSWSEWRQRYLVVQPATRRKNHRREHDNGYDPRCAVGDKIHQSCILNSSVVMTTLFSRDPPPKSVCSEAVCVSCLLSYCYRIKSNPSTVVFILPLHGGKKWRWCERTFDGCIVIFHTVDLGGVKQPLYQLL